MIVPRLYRWALNVLPRGFRRRYGNDMATMFEDTWVAGSVSDRVRVILRAVRDLTVSAIALRVRAEDDWDVPRGLNGGSARRAYGNGTGRMMMGSGGLQDLRYALKGLVARPGFAALTVLTVGLGVGASTAVFSVVDAVVFRALPYEAPDRLVSMWTVFESMGPGSFGLSDAEYIDYAKEQTSFESFGAYALGEATWRPVDSDPPASLGGLRVSGTAGGASRDDPLGSRADRERCRAWRARTSAPFARLLAHALRLEPRRDWPYYELGRLLRGDRRSVGARREAARWRSGRMDRISA